MKSLIFHLSFSLLSAVIVFFLSPPGWGFIGSLITFLVSLLASWSTRFLMLKTGNPRFFLGVGIALFVVVAVSIALVVPVHLETIVKTGEPKFHGAPPVFFPFRLDGEILDQVNELGSRQDVVDTWSPAEADKLLRKMPGINNERLFTALLLILLLQFPAVSIIALVNVIVIASMHKTPGGRKESTRPKSLKAADGRTRVFISHSSNDKQFVNQITEDLSKLDLSLWVDSKSIDPGDSIPQEIEKGLGNADYAIIVLSPDSVNSRWVKLERDAILMSDDIELIPVLTRNCEVPILLKALKYADFRESYEKGFAQLSAVFFQPTRFPRHAEFKAPKIVEATISTDNKVVVLFLTANPKNTPVLKLSHELRAIEDQIRIKSFPEALEFEAKFAVRPDDVIKILLETSPHIVHFSGHGKKDGSIILEKEDGASHPVSIEALKKTFETLKGDIRLVVFNACDTASQAEAISKLIECAVGMAGEISDDAAINFAAAFYRGLGVGSSVKNAFEQGIASLQLNNYEEFGVPQLYWRKDVDPDQLILVRETG